MTPEKLAELEKLEAAATPGPWEETVAYRASFDVAYWNACGPSHSSHDWIESGKDCRADSAQRDAELHAALRNNARDLFAALREAWRERDEARAVLQEREGDMHIRIRKGYDKTVADSWREHCAKIEKQRDEAQMQVRVLEQQVQGNGIGLMNIGMIVGCDGPGLIEKVAALKAERDEFKAKLDAELPAAWREDIESLNHLLEQSNKERDEARASLDIAYFNGRHDATALLEAARRERVTLRTQLQSHDCTYGDTPGLIHCPIDNPCTIHRAQEAERLADAMKDAARRVALQLERRVLR